MKSVNELMENMLVTLINIKQLQVLFLQSKEQLEGATVHLKNLEEI